GAPPRRESGGGVGGHPPAPTARRRMFARASGQGAETPPKTTPEMGGAGPPPAAICAPRPAIIPVLPLARRFRGAPRRATCEDRAPSGAPPPDRIRNAWAPTSETSRRARRT